MNTKQLVKARFEMFCKVYNLKTKPDVINGNNTEGLPYYSNCFIKMDFNPAYGGYRMDVVEMGTGERFFDSMARLTGKEMISYLNGLIAAKQNYPFKDIIKTTN